MSFPINRDFRQSVLGRTGLPVCRLGMAASYGVPEAAVEGAFERGINYLYWGSMRREAFARALRNLSGRRDRLVLVVQTYSPVSGLIGWSLERGLRRLGYEYTDVLLLGLWNRPVPSRILDACRKLKDRGLLRFTAVSTHNRPLVARHAQDVDIVHFRYNAVHTGAESDIFPLLGENGVAGLGGRRPGPGASRPGMVSYTATSWRQLLGHRRIPPSERTPTAGDCYRFVLTRPEVDVCLTGPASEAHVQSAMDALDRGPMTDEELAWMRRVGDAIYGKPRRAGDAIYGKPRRA